MKLPNVPSNLAPGMKITLLAALSFFASLPLTGCIVVGASSSGGWFVWPGGIGLLLFVGLILLVLVRRGR